ncbi:ABC transporter permease [Paenibacillus septentrionalis]|uniref:ABC transporter permease n=1 Tax=Paenibacillus septentrionalis TaxID=429342 RepID=A0ABW1V024_9BACL
MRNMNAVQSLKQFFLNPVIDKEYRLRMRTSRTMWTLLSYLVAMGLFAAVVFSIIGVEMRGSVYASSSAGITFIVMSFAQLGLIAFMSPGLTAGVISGEREKQTLNLLLTTQQSSFTIIVSKLISSISFMLLIVFSTLPLYGIVFLYGGIAPSQLLSVFAFYIFNMLVFGSFGVLFSTLFKRTMLAVIVTYGVVLFMFVGTGVIFLILLLSYENYAQTSQSVIDYSWILHILAINPGVALYSVLDQNFIHTVQLGIRGVSGQNFFNYVPLWLEFMIFYTIVLVLALYGAIRKLRPIKRRKRGV